MITFLVQLFIVFGAILTTGVVSYHLGVIHGFDAGAESVVDFMEWINDLEKDPS